MIGPRGRARIDEWGDDTSPETYFDLDAENVNENPPRLFDPKSPDERRADVEKRLRRQRRKPKRQRRKPKQPKVMNRKKRNFLALALLSGELGDNSGDAVAWTLRNFVGDSEE